VNTENHPSAKIILRRPQDNQILLIGRTIDDQIGLEPVGGRIETDFKNKLSETFEDCVLREVNEELGIKATITHYIGSYYFFWSIKENACSNCVLFLGNIISDHEPFPHHSDGCGLSISPVWVTLNEIKARNLPIRSYHIGLEDLLVKAANLINT